MAVNTQVRLGVAARVPPRDRWTSSFIRQSEYVNVSIHFAKEQPRNW